MKQATLVLLAGLCVGVIIGIGWHWYRRTNAPVATDIQGLKAECVSGDGAKVWLTWPPSLGAAGTRMERSENGEEFKVVAQTLINAYTEDSTVRDGQHYQYRVVLNGKTISNVATIAVDDENCQGHANP